MKKTETLHNLAEIRRIGLTRELLTEYEARHHRTTECHPDKEGYFPHIEKAKGCDLDAITSLTEWKNAAADGRPRKFFGKQWGAWKRFSTMMKAHENHVASEILKTVFSNHAPVWSLFWHHVLFGTPIFDRYTHASYIFFWRKRIPQEKEAIIPVGRHWELYAEYCMWFENLAGSCGLRTTDLVNQRWLDRALFEIGKDLLVQSRRDT